jgi:type II secretory ATPase GspE/PulE/Tfp pilus assembly ATPase PilB-like protein
MSEQQWFFEIGDGNTYGPFPMEKLQLWAASGNLMPTHRVRKADSDEWIIAAYVPGLELTTMAPEVAQPEQADDAGIGKSIGAVVRGLGRKNKSGDSTKGAKHDPKNPLRPVEPPDIVGLCNELLEISYQRNASDLHIDPEEHSILVQLRVDGELEPLRKLPKSILAPLIGRLKILSNMDIAERREPQDGRFVRELGPEKRKIHVRSACLPTTHGERMTMRLLALETDQLTLNKLGMSEGSLRTFAQSTGQKQGLVLLTGPTGSGKSTTLYAALRHRLANHPGRIITVEDPVEFDVVGVAQSEVDSGDNLRFDTVLRSILRSDPDVIMIGEIRDHDSADIAVKAALTGHLVLSSLHTNSAAGVITRMIDMGIKPYQVAATLRLCVAQRLIRRLCFECRKPRNLTKEEAKVIGHPKAEGAKIYDPGGCEKCNDRGYHGRVGLFELIPIDRELSRRIVDGCTEEDISSYAHEQKIPRLRDDAAHKLLAGVTSYAELVGVSAW